MMNPRLLMATPALLAALLLAVPCRAATARVPATAPGATLDSLLAIARERHPELRTMQHEAEAATQRRDAAGTLPDPMFGIELRDVTNAASNGDFSLSPARVGSTRYQFGQTFPPWGQRRAQRAAAQAGADEAAHRVDSTWADLALRIKTAHARWQQVHATIDQTQEIVALTERLEALAQTRYASGLAPQQDAIRAQVERTALATEIAMLEAERGALGARLNGLVARPADAPLAAPQAEPALPPAAPSDPATLRERMLARNPQLAAEDARVRAAEGNREVARSRRYPELTVGVAPMQMRNRIDEWELMLEISIPLQRGRQRAEEREAQALLAAAQARKDSAANELLAQLGEQWAALAAAHHIESLTRTRLLPQASLTLQAALAGYETGQVDFATVLDALRQNRQAQLDLINTRTEARIRAAEIERLLGERP